jgi:flagellar basal body-associated protein FliL
MAPVLKTGWVQALEGSNPSTSATHLMSPNNKSWIVITAALLLALLVAAFIIYNVMYRNNDQTKNKNDSNKTTISEIQNTNTAKDNKQQVPEGIKPTVTTPPVVK